ncbi:MAG TPA: glycosyltransferase, partial [Herpetosiphonaceae bacterium]
MKPATFAAGLAALASALMLRDLRALSRIPVVAPAPDGAAEPPVSVIIPARDEERVIERAVRGVMAQRYANWTLTVLNDHSTDRTGAILAGLAAEDGRIAVLDGAELPAGWVGKCWACWQAAQAAGGDWLLFLDADTQPQPELIAAGVAYAEAEGLDLLTVMPLLELGSFWERAILPAFLSIIEAAFPLDKINDPASDVVLANGQCILVRRAAYERAGGHRAVRDKVLEDVELAQAVVRAGGRLRVADGRHLIAVRMYTNGAEVREGLTKNAIAGLRNGGPRSAWAGARQAMVAFAPPGLLLGALWATLRRWPV